MRTKKAKSHSDQIEREVEKSISKFSEHLMSNSKWVKLINKFVQNTTMILKIEFKKVQNNQIGELYLNEDTTFGFDYWNNGFEGCNSLGGWLTFKEIEFIIFPKIVNPNKNTLQDLKEIEKLINSVGNFSLEINQDNLKLNCYKE
ncbi:hypothetical protein [Flavobacterium hydrophilum]|uniref:Uncharacterized protein n=1 Tax=Flavobacterium hydrophilum TaxID=2211445 RepID=A0A2V4C4J0_9FLAO|nr:hypothetical protein [Flavobacterium hydrophilum]PXY46095.1 hypothetical protein DMB68_02590 [Flavobacterium hydrophilum]